MSRAQNAGMQIVNIEDVEELAWSSPKGNFAAFGKQISEALGRVASSTDIMLRHPFDVELVRVPPGKAAYPYHSHSAQWEFYLIVSGTGAMRHEHGTCPLRPGDALLFKPREAHQLINDGKDDLVLYVIADNPIGESHYYPDSEKIGVGLPERRLMRGPSLEYFDGEE